MNDYRLKTKKCIAAVASGAAVNLLLFFVKLYIGLSTNSVAIYADSLNSITDFFVCIAVITGFCVSASAKTKDYPFGKGKATELTELLISAVIIGSGVTFAYISFERIMYPVPVWYSSAYAAVIAATAVIKLLLSVLLYRTSQRLGSGSIKGIAADSGLDFFITLCTFVSFTLSAKTGFFVDGIAGAVIGLILIAEGIKSAYAAASKILGKRNTEICDKAKNLIEADGLVEGVEEISYHSYGEKGVFNVTLITGCVTAAEIEKLEARLKEVIKNSFDSEIYFNFGGSNEG